MDTDWKKKSKNLKKEQNLFFSFKIVEHFFFFILHIDHSFSEQKFLKDMRFIKQVTGSS